ncbi:MAG: ATP-binding cassette domain-containing protein [Comamonadaceae bacterium]|nr:MAG: ATP-binding cassette domain-containing protein [Comamonadaceae bacterium]
MSPAPLLETRDLTVRFGAVVAVNKISVRIDAGEVVGLIGTNGAGKTTFLNMVTGYLRPTSGSILLQGRSTVGQTPRQMVAHGMARSFQVPQLFPDMTVREHILFALALAGQGEGRAGLLSPLRSPAAQAAATAVLQRFGLMDIAERTVSLVPQGQRKLIDIAMALSLKPRLLLLDEPTSGVSSAEKMPLMEVVFDAIRAGGVTVLFVEHDMDVVRRYVTRILAFRDGHMIADGAPEAVMRDAVVASAVLRGKPAGTTKTIEKAGAA